MKYRHLGLAGIKLSSIGLGGWTTFGESIKDDNLAKSIITAAYDSGITFFDIADAYARGEAERQMGAVLAQFPRHTLVISSKLFWPMSDDVNDRGLSRKHIMESVHKSLKRIGTDYLDIYFCHRYDPETPLEEVVRAMDDLVHQGKVLYWGTSEWSGAQIAEAVGIARGHNLYAPQVEQPQYNLLVRERVENEILPVVQPNGIGLTTFSPLATGILSGKYDDALPEGSRLARERGLRARWYRDDVLAKVRNLAPIAEELHITRSQLALAWLLHKPGVSSVITGATSREQVINNVQAADIDLSPELIARIEAAVA
ncbi:MAG: aldo/keto reductase family protein [Chloroflexi bacterium]|nr:aldo/keto reductase family protein [Chloroflexota bacterium]